MFVLRGKGPGQETIYRSHERLPDADTADAMKAYWHAALVHHKGWLE